MNQEFRQRLVGAVVLIVLGIIVLPMILDKPAVVTNVPEVTEIQLIPSPEIRPIPVLPQETSVQTIPPEVIARYEEVEPENVSELDDEVKVDQEKVAVTKVPERKVEKKVDQKTTKKTKSNKPQWAVQIGSFSSKENASRLVDRLKADKLPAYFEDLSSKGKTIYRVRVGPIDSKVATEKMKQKLDQKEKIKTLIVALQ